LNTPLFIAKRIAFNRDKSFSGFIIRLAVTATVISVAAMILSLAFINGFQKVVSEKVFSFWGHIRVQHFEPVKVSIAEESPIRKNDTIEAEIASQSNVAYVQTFATKSAIINANASIEGVLFKGVDKGYHFDELDQFLMEGRWINFTDSGYAPEIVISSYSANRLNLKTNDDVLIYFIQPGEEKPRTRKLKITGIYKTGIDVYDRTFALGDLRLIQRLNNWGDDEIGGYEVRLKDYTQMAANSDEIYDKLPVGWNCRTMKEIYPEIFDWLNLQDTNKYILLTVMIIVALINLITCLIILVLERIRMIGVLKALGAKNITIQTIFIHHTLIITITGIILGTLLALGLLYLQQETGFIKLQEEAYYLSEAAVKIVWWQILLIISCTFAVCLVILTIPSLLVRRIQPVKAIQFR